MAGKALPRKQNAIIVCFSQRLLAFCLQGANGTSRVAGHEISDGSFIFISLSPSTFKEQDEWNLMLGDDSDMRLSSSWNQHSIRRLGDHMLVPEVNGLVAFLSRPHERAFYGGAHQEFCAIMRRLKKAFYPLMARQ